MNTNDLPPAAKLAALIEAGRAANPDLKQGRGRFYCPHRGEACALGFAAMASGIERDLLRLYPYSTIEDRCGISYELLEAVETSNDSGAGLDEIILSLREGALAKVCA